MRETGAAASRPFLQRWSGEHGAVRPRIANAQFDNSQFPIEAGLALGIGNLTIGNCKVGGAEGIRTPGLLNAIETRSQLRYSPLREPLYYTRSYKQREELYGRTDGVADSPADQECWEDDVAAEEDDVRSAFPGHGGKEQYQAACAGERDEN